MFFILSHPLFRSFYLSVSLSLSQSIYIFNRSLSIYKSIYLCINLFVYPSISLSIHLSIYLSIHLFICLSLYLCIHVCICASICVSIHHQHSLCLAFPFAYLDNVNHNRCLSDSSCYTSYCMVSLIGAAVEGICLPTGTRTFNSSPFSTF